VLGAGATVARPWRAHAGPLTPSPVPSASNLGAPEVAANRSVADYYATFSGFQTSPAAMTWDARLT